MQEMDDMALLREYATRNSEAAFETLVSRRVNFVYAAALRQVCDPHLAEEVTQAVFMILAQKAGRISDQTILCGWLFKTTRFAALAQMRAAVLRQQREQEAHMQSELQQTAPDPLWEQMSPLLDEALAMLGEKDRQAVLLRFFENKSLRAVGSHLGTGEDTARKRVSRALEKLRKFFSKRGVSSTTAIIAGAISANSVQAAPAVLAKTATAIALAKGAAASGSTLILVKGTLNIMAWVKAKTVVAVGAAATLVIAGTATVALTHAKGIPTEQQLQQLFDSVSRDLPEKMRVVSLHVREKAPPSEAEIKRTLDMTRKMGERIQAGVPEPVRSQRIEANIRLRKLTMTGTHYEKIQEWKSGALYRMDTANGWESLEEADRKTNYDTTRINLVNPTNGGTSMLEIAYAIKSFRISDGAQSTEAGAWNGMTVEGQVALTIALALASNESIMRKAKDVKQKLEIDRVKLQRVLSGDDPVYKVHLIESEMDGQPRHIFEFELGKPQPQGEQATVLIECDNSNHITRTEIKNKKGQIRLRSARSKFDSQDVPHEYTLIEREQDAYITNKFFIKEAQLNADFSDDEVFRLAPPKDYGVVVDGPGGKPIIKSYPDGIKPTKIIDVSDIVSDYNSRRPGWKWILIGLLALIFIATLGHIGWKMVKRPR